MIASDPIFEGQNAPNHFLVTAQPQTDSPTGQAYNTPPDLPIGWGDRGHPPHNAQIFQKSLNANISKINTAGKSGGQLNNTLLNTNRSITTITLLQEKQFVA